MRRPYAIGYLQGDWNLGDVGITKDKLFIYWIASIAALGGFLFGYDTGIISGALVFIKQSFSLTRIQQEVIVSTVVLGALLGAVTSGKLADQFGRRQMLIIIAWAFMLGSFLTSLAPSPFWLIVGRLILGLAIGASSYITPLFISEMAPAQRRGSLVLLNAIAITGGEALSFLVDYWLAPTHSWRLIFITGLIPAFTLFLGMLFLPATPRWIASKGYFDKAKETLKKIHHPAQAEQALSDIKLSLNQPHGPWRDLFNKNIRFVLLLGLGLGVLQQFVGINTVMYYGPSIFQAAGFSHTSMQLLATFIMGMVNMVMSIIAVFLVDYMGRRKLMLIGLTIAGLSLAIVGANFYFKFSSALSHWVTLIFMMSYIAGYCISIGSLFWLIIAEIYPLRIRGRAMSFVTAVQWMANFIVALTFLSILHGIGAASTFWLYGLVCVLGIAFSYKYLPETNGLSLEKIEQTIHT